MKRYKLIILIVMVFSLIWTSSALGMFGKIKPWTLKGVDGMFVFLESLKPDLKGLESKIRTDVELKLRLAGIKIVEPKIGVPYIYINVNNLKKSNGGFFYSISCEFKQGVLLARKYPGQVNLAEFSFPATTWDRSAIGFGEVADIRALIKDLVDIFVNDYLSVNPKK